MILKRFFLRLTDNELSRGFCGKYEEGFFDLTFRFQYLIGIYQDGGSWIYKMYRITVYWLMTSVILGEFYQLYHSYNIDTIVDNMSVTTIHLICFYRFYDMVRYRHLYIELTRAMQAQSFDVKNTRRQKMVKIWATKSRRSFLFLLVIATCTLATWYVYPLLDDVEYNFPVSIRLPFDHRSTERYFYCYIYVLIAFHYISCFVVMVDLTTQCFLVHLNCQFCILVDCFRSVIYDSMRTAEEITGRSAALSDPVTEYAWRKTYDANLRNHIRQHQLLLGNAAILKKVLSIPMFGQFLASSLLICFSGYGVTSSASVNVPKFLMTIQYLSYTLLQLYVLCSWCNEISVQFIVVFFLQSLFLASLANSRVYLYLFMESGSIGEAVYSCGWERDLGGAARGAGALTLRIVMARSVRPVMMTAGGIYDLSLASYMTLVKTSYSALTVLLRLRQ